MKEVAAWAGIGAMVIVNIIAWVVAYMRYYRNEGKAMGRLEGKVDAFCGDVAELKKGIIDIHDRLGRIEGQLNGMHPVRRKRRQQ